MSFTPPTTFQASSFSIFQRSLMQNDELPLADVVDGELFQQAFDRHAVDFGDDDDAVYTPAITLWALISQVFFAETQRSCKAAVMRVAALWATLGKTVCDTNTGAYCRARLKIPCEVVRDITRHLALAAEQGVSYDHHIDDQDDDALHQSPRVVAEVRAQSQGSRVLLLDGFVISAADTPENQAEYPQKPSQEEGLGFPLLRCVTLTSLFTGLLFDLACGPYSGKETGETALMRELLDVLQAGDTLVADCHHCTYWTVAACRARGVHIVMKNHHKRDDHPAGAVRLCKGERLVTWTRPPRPDWMNVEEYEQQPETISIRLVDVHVKQKGFRPDKFTVATTLIDDAEVAGDWIRSVYESRWLVELDIRAVKCSLNMDILRAKTPPMVRTELWSCLLAYNLIRLKMLQSCAASGRDPRSLSFTTTQQLLATNWLLCAVIGVSEELATLGQQTSGSERVGHRDGRVEPRANKRRPKVLALMTKPR
ncbi:MAG: IS4 family transposase, partial [Planctomycetota bacterium]